MMPGWKRRHITTRMVLAAYLAQSQCRSDVSTWVDETLEAMTGAPLNVIWAAMLREEKNGFVEYGTNLRGGWLTIKGRQRLMELDGNEMEDN